MSHEICEFNTFEDKFEKYPETFYENRLTRGFVFENNTNQIMSY